jgi:hypothetical protein
MKSQTKAWGTAALCSSCCNSNLNGPSKLFFSSASEALARVWGSQSLKPLKDNNFILQGFCTETSHALPSTYRL